MATYIANAFSLSMLPHPTRSYTIAVTPLTRQQASNILRSEPFVSAVGHADTAALVSDHLALPVAFNRTSVTLTPQDRLVVAQHTGPRLPEGATKLPQGNTLTYFLITLQ